MEEIYHEIGALLAIIRDIGDLPRQNVIAPRPDPRIAALQGGLRGVGIILNAHEVSNLIDAIDPDEGINT